MYVYVYYIDANEASVMISSASENCVRLPFLLFRVKYAEMAYEGTSEYFISFSKNVTLLLNARYFFFPI